MAAGSAQAHRLGPSLANRPPAAGSMSAPGSKRPSAIPGPIWPSPFCALPPAPATFSQSPGLGEGKSPIASTVIRGRCRLFRFGKGKQGRNSHGELFLVDYTYTVWQESTARRTSTPSRRVCEKAKQRCQHPIDKSL
ncbi:uncharacterized protein SPSK_10661 [Sporothrix schenckii 1099-18]|uniref:Uncharacterized protein n=1 Tax=Sporothrix schenckii 1099-18 TaxID=1397361 RepID=A0A0F2LTT9_SPOSC|nr:uncharacterized protein SPSK_10661 [Sporothrix schenckii 1099-18]KJR80897.1 hypothetical protein SPSK_10661 [Sporothrix schenckii 1099-18]